MKKRSISVMFAIAAAAALNMTAFAETKTPDTSESKKPYTITLYANDSEGEDNEIEIDVNAEEFSINLADDDTYDSDSGIITWDQSKKTLTLDSVKMEDVEEYTDLIYISYPSTDGTAHCDFTVRLKGKNELHAGYRAIATAGIADLNIVAEGDATLDAKAENNAALMSNSEMEIKGGSYEINSAGSDKENRGIYAAQGLKITNADIQISNAETGILVTYGDTVITGKDTSLDIHSEGSGISVRGKLKIQNIKELNIEAGEFGINSDGNITIDGGDCSIIAEDSFGIFATDAVISLNPDKLMVKSTYMPILVQENKTEGKEIPSAGIRTAKNLKLSGVEAATSTWLSDGMGGQFAWSYFVTEGTEKDSDGLINYYDTMEAIVDEVSGEYQKPIYHEEDDEDDDDYIVVSKEPVRKDDAGAEAISGSWTQSEDGSWSFNGNDSSYQNEWGYIENPYASEGQNRSDWFRFDENGVMITGWFLDADGNWYYLNPTSDGTKGAMQTGWQWIVGADGAEHCYYLNPVSDGTRGKLFVNTTTPDGFLVNADGAWIVDGKEQTR